MKLSGERNTIKYSIENSSWMLETDVITNKKIKKLGRHSLKRVNKDIYYVNIKKYDKEVSVSKTTYNDLQIGEKVYIVVAKEKENYAIVLVMPEDATTYIERLP